MNEFLWTCNIQNSSKGSIHATPALKYVLLDDRTLSSKTIYDIADNARFYLQNEVMSKKSNFRFPTQQGVKRKMEEARPIIASAQDDKAKKPRITCWSCGKEGHREVDCRSKLRSPLIEGQMEANQM